MCEHHGQLQLRPRKGRDYRIIVCNDKGVYDYRDVNGIYNVPIYALHLFRAMHKEMERR